MTFPINLRLLPQWMGGEMPNPGQQAPPQPAPARPPQSGLQRILGRLLPTPQGLLPEEEESARRQGLLQLGAGLLESAGPQPYRVSLGQAFARSLGPAQQRASEFGAGLAQQRTAQAAAQQRAAIFERYGPELDRAGTSARATGEVLLRMLPEFIKVGDTETVARLSELLKSMGLGDAARNVVLPRGSRLVGPDGRVITEADHTAAPGSAPGSRTMILRNPKTGLPEVYIYDPAARSFTPTGMRPGSMRGLTETQAKMRAHLEMAESAIALLDAAAGPLDRWTQFARGKGLGEAISDRDQLVDVASRQVADAFLRMTTGAAYNAEELTNALVINTPRAGDSERTRQYKVGIRRRMLKALRILASGEYSPPEPGGISEPEQEILNIIRETEEQQGDSVPRAPWESP